MTQTAIRSGQTYTGTGGKDDYVLIEPGATALGATVYGGQIVLDSGATATGTMVSGVRVAPGVPVTTSDYGTYVGGTLYVGNGATADGTSVGVAGTDYVTGTDRGATVQSGGTYFVSGGGISTGAVFAAGSSVTVASAAILNDATVQPFGGLILGANASISNLTLGAGTYVALGFLRYVAGGSAVLNSAADTLTITEGASSLTLSLAGSYSGDVFAVAPEQSAQSTSGTVLLVTDSSGANSFFGFNDYRNSLLLGQNQEPDSPVQAGLRLALNTTIVTGAAYASMPDPVSLTNTVYAAIANAGAGGVLPGLYATALGSAGDQAIYSTVDAVGHVITATGTGTSMIAAGSGMDTVTVRNGTDQVVTGQGTNTIYLQTGSNTLISQGTDSIYIGGGSDTIDIAGQAVMFGSRAMLTVSLESETARLSLHTGIGAVIVRGGNGGGTFSGGTGGHNTLIAGTSSTTLYAGGDGDALFGSGGSSTTMNGWGGNETMNGSYGSGVETFNFNGANVTASSGTGQNTFNIGSGNNVIDASLGRSLFNITSGAAGGTDYIGGFNAGSNHIHLAGYAADEVGLALSTAGSYQGSEILQLRDGSSITFGGVTGLTGASFV